MSAGGPVPDRLKAGEAILKRGTHSTTIRKPDGGMRAVVSLGPKHYVEGGQLVEIDATPVSADGIVWTTVSTPYRMTWDVSTLTLVYESKAVGKVQIRLAALDGVPFEPVKAEAEVVGRRIKSFATPDLQIHLAVRKASVEIFKVLMNENAPKALTWEVTDYPGGNISVDLMGTRGMDNINRIRPRAGIDPQRPIEIAHTMGPERRERGARIYTVEERFTGRTRFVDPDTMARTWVDEVIYPVEIDVTVTENIAAAGDDGRGRTPAYYRNNESPNIDSDRGGSWRFTSVDVPQGATINSAILTVNCTSREGSGTAILAGEDTDDAPTWSSYSANSSLHMTATTANTSYPIPATTGIKTIDVTSIIQEIVNRAGWTNNNDIRLGFSDVSGVASGYNGANFEAYEAAGTDEAQLDIDYTAGGASGQPTMARWNGVPGMSQTNSFGRGW